MFGHRKKVFSVTLHSKSGRNLWCSPISVNVIETIVCVLSFYSTVSPRNLRQTLSGKCHLPIWYLTKKEQKKTKTVVAVVQLKNASKL